MTIVVSVAYATPSLQEIVDVELRRGASAREAIEQSGLVAAYALDVAALGIAIFGRRASLDTVLADGDRVELVRALPADPKEARRRRALAKPIARTPPRVKHRDR
jgi:putative ubiquitin-RnfH superfamily antitoxin RatB of RatAB toxin-antitoxin module